MLFSTCFITSIASALSLALAQFPANQNPTNPSLPAEQPAWSDTGISKTLRYSLKNSDEEPVGYLRISASKAFCENASLLKHSPPNSDLSGSEQALLEDLQKKVYEKLCDQLDRPSRYPSDSDAIPEINTRNLIGTTLPIKDHKTEENISTNIMTAIAPGAFNVNKFTSTEPEKKFMEDLEKEIYDSLCNDETNGVVA